MEGKKICVVSTVLNCIGILLLLGAAFDVLPITDNFAIFLGIGCFVIGGMAKKLAKGTSSCCK